MTNNRTMIHNKSYYDRLAAFSWKRAHMATDPKWRTRWFDVFEVAITFRNITRA